MRRDISKCKESIEIIQNIFLEGLKKLQIFLQLTFFLKNKKSFTFGVMTANDDQDTKSRNS